jgi:hypothetical protein
MNPVVKKYLRRLFQLLRTLMLAYMVGVGNIVKEETRYIDDSHIQNEYQHVATDDEPIEELMK